MISRNQEPSIQSVDSFHLLNPETTKLSNGIPVIFFETGDQDLLRIEFMFETGALYHKNSLVTALTNRLLQEGTKTKQAAEIAEYLDFYGAYLQQENGYNSSSVTLYALTAKLKMVLPLVIEILSEPAFPENELEVIKRNSIQNLQVNLEKVSFLARKTMVKALFGSTHPYGFTADASDYEKVTSSDLEQFYLENYQLNNLKILIAGKGCHQVIDQLEKLIGQKLLTNKTNNAILFAQEPAEATRINVSKADAVQNAIRMGIKTIGKRDVDYIGLKILNTVLGGYFGSRLMQNIREEKGYTYGIGSAISSFPTDAYFTIGTEVGADVSEAAIQEIHKEINLLRSNLIPSEELDRVRSYLLGSMLGSFDGAFSWIDRYKDVALFDLDFNYYQRMFTELKSVQPERLLVLANKYLDPDKMYLVVAGKV